MQSLKLFLLLVLFSSGSYYSQVSISNEKVKSRLYSFEVETNFNEYSLLGKSNGSKIIKFDNYLDESKSTFFTLPRRDVFVAIPPNSKPTVNFRVLENETLDALPPVNPVLTQMDSETIIYKEAGEFNLEIPPQLEVKGYLWLGDNYVIHLSLGIFQPDTKSRSTAKIIKYILDLEFPNSIQFSSDSNIASGDVHPLILNKNAAALLKSKREIEVAETDSWINYDQDYLKLSVGEDGIYRITAQDLTENGISTAISSSTLKLFNRGSEVEIFIDDNGDGTFNADDYLEFVAFKNYDGNHRTVNDFDTPYNEYLNRYSDSTFFFLTWNGANGKRMDAVKNANLSPVDTVDFYDKILHFEENPWSDFTQRDLVRRQNPDWQENETWNWLNQSVQTRNLNFTVENLYPDRTAKAFVKGQGRAGDVISDTYNLVLRVNNNSAALDSARFDRYDRILLAGEFSSNELINGANKLKYTSLPTASTLNWSWIDWYELEFPVYALAENNTLHLQYPSLKNDVVGVVKISNVTTTGNSLFKFSTSGTFRVSNTSYSNSTLTFADTVKINDHYFLATDSTVLKPKFLEVKKFKNLRNSGNQADYLVITHPTLLNASAEYTAFIEDEYNVNPFVSNIFDIYDEFSYGYPEPESVKEFLKAVHLNWQTPLVSNVVLIGEANWDYKGNVTSRGIPRIPNLVPTYGVPSSDTWFTIWDTTGAFVPNMNIGRIAALNANDISHYMEKHKAHLARPFDEINKNFLLFSGGKGDNPTELRTLKNANDYVEQLIQNRPTAGNSTHFYKTTDPKTDFGPYTDQFISSKIETGGLFISYLGHSGVQIWDNTIVSPVQLQNETGIKPLITDFGCSTAKFSEPELNSFSEIFTLSEEGQAIAYIGNSSLGFISSSTIFPSFFYPRLLNSESKNVGQAHNFAKYDLLQNYGTSGVYTAFSLCNTLIGDPIVNLKVPSKPSLKITSGDVQILESGFSEKTDSLTALVRIFNFGQAPEDSFKISFKQTHNSQILSIQEFQKVLPKIQDSIVVKFSVESLPGQHTLSFVVDSGNDIEEIYEDDNSIDYGVFVPSLALKTVKNNLFYNSRIDTFFIVNPTIANEGVTDLLVEYDTLNSFETSQSFTVPIDTFTTKIVFENLLNARRYYFRVRDNISGSDYSPVYSFFNRPGYDFLIADSIALAGINTNNLQYDRSNGLILSEDKYVIEVFSGGFNDGATAIGKVNGTNYMDLPDETGHHIVVLDRETLKFESDKIFNLFGGASVRADYIAHLDSLDDSKIVLFAITDEGSSGLSAELKAKIKEFGSAKIDSVGWRAQWAMIGWKGAASGAVPEKYAPAFGGIVNIDTTIIKKRTEGKFVTPEIGPATFWEELLIEGQIPTDASVTFNLLGVKNDLSTDTLKTFAEINTSIGLQDIDAKQYSNLKIEAELKASSDGASPSVNSVGINFNEFAELGTNYQVVWVTEDSILIGETAELKFYVYNSGDVKADSILVKVNSQFPSKPIESIYSEYINSLNPNSRKLVTVPFTSLRDYGIATLSVEIDADNTVNEYFEDNNFYTTSLVVKNEFVVPNIELQIENGSIFDGQYVSNEPQIDVTLSDFTPIPISKRVNLTIELNDQIVDTNDISYTFSSSNPKVIAAYKPNLEDGDYELKIYGMDALENPTDTIYSYFKVTNEVKILDVYNYPNPFSDETHFTFKLTQIPDEVNLKIFTIAGRLIKEINISNAELKHDFNKIFWDGRDDDGDLIANGVYIYKLLMKVEDKTESLTSKLAIVR
ncbi:MAG: hypothetical protein K9G44_08025 [Melioribacteraceae bacterium]|nr:hypothetical protein [Melioribacteraceae bacterium]